MIVKKDFGVIFDLDGVLIDSLNVMKIAFDYAFKQFFPDKESPFSTFIKHSGKGFLTIMDEMNLPREISQYFSKKSIELIPEIKVFFGIETILTNLKQSNVYIGIATGKDKYRTQLILKQKKLLCYFDQIVGSDEVERGKPYPDSINWHIKQSGLRNDQLIFVGDSVSDIQSARNANVLSVAVLWGLGKREDLLQEKPNYIAHEMDDLIHIFLKVGLLSHQLLN